jgi:hypothetical protein
MTPFDPTCLNFGSLPATATPRHSQRDSTGLTPRFIRYLNACWRDSWPQKDFKSLADEFHFMPLNIRDTLNEWADEALGDFILDGEDPVVIRRELITKEKVYG